MAPILVFGTPPVKSVVLVITVISDLLVKVSDDLLHSNTPHRVSVPVSNQIVPPAGDPTGRDVELANSDKLTAARVT